MVADFEFRAPPGHRPYPVCLVARELVSGRNHRLWLDSPIRPVLPPYPIDRHTLFIAYYASAELGCHLALDWPLPPCVLDLYVEFRALTNGRTLPCGAGLLGALTYYGLDSLDASTKDAMRDIVIRGGPWSLTEREDILNYCGTDVDALARLFVTMAPSLDGERSLLRGDYMRAAAAMERTGIPVDAAQLSILRTGWHDIQDALVSRIDGDFGVFDGRRFSASRFEAWLVRRDIPWPRLESGSLALDDQTFREMARLRPEVQPLRDLRHALAQLRLSDLAIGPDARNRTMLSAFRAKTGRNQPSNSGFIFGTAKWLRGLIRPEPTTGLAYIDWSQQEFGIAAALSGDSAMQSAYQSGDPYLAFAKQAGAAPAWATRESHAAERSIFKVVALGVQYGMGANALALRLGIPPIRARELLSLHQHAYPRFWRWSDGAVDHAMLRGRINTVFGWPVFDTLNPCALRNFPMQANGAEMLRLACVMAHQQKVSICAPVHDAILIEAPLVELEAAVLRARTAMRTASSTVLGGFALDTDVKWVRAPDRFMEESGSAMWRTVWDLISKRSSCPYPH